MGVRRWLPFGVFALLLVVVAVALWRPADRSVRSALVGKTLPAFALPPAVPGKPGVSRENGTGRPRLLNVFASWCLPCIAESPQLLRLKALGVPIDGIAIHDTAPALQQFLARNGDPYTRIGSDRTGVLQLALGSSGVPETYVIDARGRIVLQHIGDIHADEVDSLAAAVRDAR